MNTIRIFVLFSTAAIVSLMASKQWVKLFAVEKDELSIERYAPKTKEVKVKIENVLYNKVESVGSIVGAFKPQNKLTNDDMIYLRFKNTAVSVGDRFLIYKNRGGVKDPNKIFGTTGQSAEFRGAVQITSVLPDSVTGKIYDAGFDIEVGDELMPWRDLNVTIAPQEPTSDIRGRVMSSASGVEMIGAFDFAYLNMGAKNGLKVNDRLYAFVTGDGSRELTKGLPEVNIAELVVVDVQDNFSTAYVLSAVDRVEAGTAIKTAIPAVKYLNSAAEGSSGSEPQNQ